MVKCQEDLERNTKKQPGFQAEQQEFTGGPRFMTETETQMYVAKQDGC